VVLRKKQSTFMFEARFRDPDRKMFVLLLLLLATTA
jgi:hypothetical protein